MGNISNFENREHAVSIMMPAVAERRLSWRTIGIEINSTMWGMRVGIFQANGAGNSRTVGIQLAVSVMEGCVLSGMFGRSRPHGSDVRSMWLVSMTLNTGIESRCMLDAGMKLKVTTRPDNGAEINRGDDCFLRGVLVVQV